MKSIKVALAEDHKVLLDTLSNMLDNEDDIDVVIKVTNGKKLLHKLRTIETDVILLDLDMKEMDGRKAFSLIQQFHNTTKVIFLSYHYTKLHVQKYIGQGACGYISKDSDYEVVVQGIRNVFECGKFINGLVTEKMYQGNNSMFNDIFAGDPLSDREIEVLRLICLGKSSSEIADILNLSPRTVDNHRARIKLKINTKTIAETVHYAFKKGIVEVDI